jgi:hypothetical protein
MRKVIVIAQFQVTRATSSQGLTVCMDANYTVGHKLTISIL